MSNALFFYGTLCHIPLLESVLGRSAARIDVQEAELADHRVTWVKDQPFPMIAIRTGETAHGVLVSDLSAEDIARLRFYEGGFEYDLTPVTVQTTKGSAQAQVFYPEPGLWTPGAHWVLADWVARWGDLSVRAAHEAMGHFGMHSAEEMARLLPFLRARAWSHELAATGAPSTLRRETNASSVTVTPIEADNGFFRLQGFDVSHPRFDGAQSPVLRRAGFVAYDAALVLPYDPVTDRVMLIEQLRYGPLLRGDPQPWVLEPIAGLVDAGEAPIESARREAVEEAGLVLSDIRPMVRVYASPGYSTEFFHCFLAICDLDPHQAGLGGLESESEDIRSHVIAFSRALELLDSGEMGGGPMAMMLLWLARARDGLRADTVRSPA